MNNPLLDELLERRLVAIFRGVPLDKAAKTAQALEAGGIRFVEICFNQSSPDPLQEFEALFKAVKAAVSEKVHIGAGTVMTREQLLLLDRLGGQLFVAPNTDPEMIRLAKDCGMIAIPGAMTPTEIAAAYEAGADIVKLYIVEDSKTVRMLRGPLGHIPMEITCNVSLDTIPAFLDAGVKAFGTKAVLPDGMVQQENYDGIRQLAEKFCLAAAG